MRAVLPGPPRGVHVHAVTSSPGKGSGDVALLLFYLRTVLVSGVGFFTDVYDCS